MLKINSFDEIRTYLDVPEEAIAFLKSITEETENGRYPFSPDCFVNVMNCTTKTELSPAMEAHDVFIDEKILSEAFLRCNTVALHDASRVRNICKLHVYYHSFRKNLFDFCIFRLTNRIKYGKVNYVVR